MIRRPLLRSLTSLQCRFQEASTAAAVSGDQPLKSTQLRTTINNAAARKQALMMATRPFSDATAAAPAMFCRQCEQTKDGVACTTLGICGKTPETSALQDALLEVIKSVSIWAVAARNNNGGTSPVLAAANEWSLRAAFSTLTNVNFSDARIAAYIQEGMDIKHDLVTLLHSLNVSPLPDVVEGAPAAAALELPVNSNNEVDPQWLVELEDFGRTVGVLQRADSMTHGEDAMALNELATYGAKGVSAYACHAMELGADTSAIMVELHQVWATLASKHESVDTLLATALKVGEINATTMALLDAMHCEQLGTPEPTPVRMTAVEGKANILVSGHDMMDLLALLEQTKDQNVNVYTHGEMLPAHMYPRLKAFPHLVGNYGTAWQAQKFEFATFPGPIVVTTNCIVAPRRTYQDRLFTTNEVGVDGVQHVTGRDFSHVIAMAKGESSTNKKSKPSSIISKGFPRTVEPARYHTVGFNHRAVLPLANDILQAVQGGQLSRVFVIGGCDGSEWDRSYYTDLAEATPKDSLILTLGCAKNRLIHSPNLMQDTIALGGDGAVKLPRVLDMGQCNDSYSAVVVALELAKALNCSVNDLPLSLALSHLEQKAAAVLLTLLHLGVKNIRLGPKLPAYITPNVLQVLQDRYNLMPTTTAEHDLPSMMAGN